MLMILKDLKLQVTTRGQPNISFQKAYSTSGYNAKVTFCISHKNTPTCMVISVVYKVVIVPSSTFQ